MDINRAADVGKREGKKSGVNMANGHDIQAKVLLIKAEINATDEIKCYVGFMGAHHSFGFSGGAGRVNQNPGVCGCHFSIGFAVRRTFNKILVWLVSLNRLSDDNVVLG